MKIYFRKMTAIFLCVLLVALCLTLASCFESESNDDQSSESAEETTKQSTNALGNYQVEIKSCRLAEDYEGKPIVIVNFKFTNNDDEAQAFYTAVEASVFQDGIGLNECYVADESANYSDDNQTKEIKSASSIEVEVAYVLNDTETDLDVEVTEWISLSDKKITKKFSIK